MGKNNKDLVVDKLEAELTIHEKYAHYVKMAKDGYIRDIAYNEMMEMVQHIQKKRGLNYPFNPTCATCIISMVLLFDKVR